MAQYVWHPYYIDALLLRDYDEDADGIVVRYYYTQDVNFNVLSILSSTGTVLERYGYTPYGQAEVLTASFTADSDGLSDSDNDITFTGQRYDSESRLMLYRHRYYHPVLGTFCSRDPIGYEGSQWNLYEYVGGRGLVALDPSGSGIILGPSTDEDLLTKVPPLLEFDDVVFPFPPDPTEPDYSPCDGYDFTVGSKCKDECNTWVDDPHPAKAKDICKKFLDIYASSEESVGKIWFWQGSQVVVESVFVGFLRSKAV